ncbi:TRAP transporter substrate-binding protein DctP [Desulfobacula sp.]|uniref:TRAP transporter substrate-binding protein n=1 Tax=Desulfobacula sp. TaxID=2593537 RepID=UPI002608F2CF|nr:TRAP transporter substrate-binding protein DctP [Desulfobacula sp.]
MKKIFNRLIIVVLGIWVLSGLTFVNSVSNANAADTITLTYAGLWPPAHPMSVATKLWIEKIEKETNGRVKIKAFWAGALYRPRASAMELAKGVADIGDFSGAYAPMGYDFEKSMRMVFWGVNDKKFARTVYHNVMAKYPQLTEEFTKAGIKVMAYASIPPYQLLLSKKEVKTTADIKGMTIKASGDLAKVATGLGGEGIVMPMSESYTALQKTTIDGVFAPYETMKSFRFAEVVKYALELNIASAPAGHWGFCLKSWNKLPADIQKVFEDNIEWFGGKIEELVFAGEALGIALGKKNNVKFISLSPEELNKVYTVVNKEILSQMAKLDDKGLPGTDVYNEIRAQIKAANK